jgi:hypothetical protein
VAKNFLRLWHRSNRNREPLCVKLRTTIGMLRERMAGGAFAPLMDEQIGHIMYTPAQPLTTTAALIIPDARVITMAGGQVVGDQTPDRGGHTRKAAQKRKDFLPGCCG